MSQATAKAKPSTLTTTRYKRNLIITGILIAALICAAVIVVLSFQPSKIDDPPEVVQSLMVADDVQQAEGQEVIDTINTPEHARSFISQYYQALSEKSVSGLRQIGAISAANAADRGWLAKLDYKVDMEKVANPDAQAFPQSQGLYAGCTLYKIRDFYSGDTSNAIWNNATGLTGVEGWIYYDPINVKWVIADPTIPTAFAAPSATKITRESAEGIVTVTMEDAGVWSNPWWAWSEAQISISNKSNDTTAAVTIAEFDKGFTVVVPDQLRAGCPPATASGATTVSERCIMYRGTLVNFGIDKIGAPPLEVDGNICPIIVSVGNENVAPVFGVGKADSEILITDIAEEQIKQYGATEERTDYLNPTPSDAQDGSEGAGESNASNGNAQ